MTNPLPFPRQMPAGYAPLGEEPRFDPARHLALERPSRVWTLAEFGYDAGAIAATPSPVALAGPFRVLSEDGVAAAREVARRLEPFATASLRTARYLTGGVYRSRFLRDLVGSPELVAFLSEIAGTALLPHTMPAMQIYVNYAPADVRRHIDPWHTDSIGFDIVIMVTDPRAMKGGAFQVFRGTVDQAARALGTTPEHLTEGGRTELPEDRVESVVMPGPGFAIFQQGNLVVHRASRLLEAGERITFVPGYVAADADFPDPTRAEAIVHWGEPGLAAELARHKAWLARSRLDALIRDLPADADPATAAAALKAALADAALLADSLAALKDAR